MKHLNNMEFAVAVAVATDAADMIKPNYTLDNNHTTTDDITA